MASSTASGWAWDVPRVKFLTLQGEEYPMSQCTVITSRDCCKGFEGSNAFRDEAVWWGGRKNNGIFFIGLQCPVPEMHITKVMLLQGVTSDSKHTAALVQVQKLVSGSDSWVTMASPHVPVGEMVELLDSTPTLHGGCCQVSAENDACASWEYAHGKCIVLMSRSIGCNRATWAAQKTYDAHSGRCIDLQGRPRRLLDQSNILV